MARVYCVTGATGLVASHLVKALLHRGHLVRATVRDPEDETKVGFLRELDGAKERLRLYKADLTVEASFDEAVQGVYGVFHVAAPVVYPRENEDVHALVIDPIVKGTCNVLNSCAKSTTLKRVVLTSSIFAINNQPDDSRLIYNESHWTDLDHCKRNNMWYAYAKTVAEQTAWKRAEECGLDLVTVLPTLVVGPVLNRQPSSTVKYILDLINGALGAYKDKYMFFVHVEDVAAVHILAMENPAAQGRLICSNKTIKGWAEVIGMLREKYPMYPYETKAIKDSRDQHVYELDIRKVMQLGFPGFKNIPEIFDDCIKSLQEKGLLRNRCIS